MMKVSMSQRSSSRMSRGMLKEKLPQKTMNRWNRLRTKINPIHRPSNSDDDGKFWRDDSGLGQFCCKSNLKPWPNLIPWY
jgi:hypothetical protein